MWKIVFNLLFGIFVLVVKNKASIGEEDRCIYSFNVWKPDQEITRRLENMDLRDINRSAYFTQELYRFKSQLLQEILMARNQSNHVEKLVLEHKLQSVKSAIEHQELRVKVMALEKERLKSPLATNVIEQPENVNSKLEQLRVDIGQLSEKLLLKSSSFRNEIGDLKAEWLLIKREIQDLERGVETLNRVQDTLKTDIATVKSNGKKTLEDIIAQGLLRQQTDTDEIKRNINLLRTDVENVRSLYSRVRTENIKLQEQLTDTRLTNSYLQIALAQIQDGNITMPMEEVLKMKNLTKGTKDINSVNIPKDCHDVYNYGHKSSSVYQVKPTLKGNWYDVYCEMFNSIGWTVIQRRIHGSLDFKRRWLEYKFGFGNPYDEFWIGNEILYDLTNQKRHALRIDMWDWKGGRAYAEYTNFSIDDEQNQYRLHVGGFSGSSGDSMSYHDNMAFSTEDMDNDLHARNCATDNKGGWWYNSCYASNLNGMYHTSWYSRGGPFADGIVWYTLKQSDYYSLKRVEMKIRPLIL